MKRLILFAALVAVATQSSYAQFTVQGKIEYEKKSNVHRQLEDMSSDDEDGGESWYSKIKSQIPKFSTSYFDYTFNQKASLYKPGRETENPIRMFGSAPASDNTVFTDFEQGRVAAQKQVFEQKYLVQDSLRKLKWKLTDEIRTIANFKCRKAVSRICDSVYVVAFYTEDIMVSGGPESFSGLPGMILELAIPRLHTTWIATRVELIAPDPALFKAPEKGKKVDSKGLYDDLMASISKWGKWAQRSIWWSTL